MKTEIISSSLTIYRSEVRPEVSIDCPKAAEPIAWADAHPKAWNIVTQTRSKAFGRRSCMYIGWAQRSLAPEAILERLSDFHRLATGRQPHLSPNHIQCWAARHTFEHYRVTGFTGGFFQQHDERYARLCMTLDYTPGTLNEVIQRFLNWCGNLHHTTRVTVDGKTVWENGGGHG
jgi:hypothetical protein